MLFTCRAKNEKRWEVTGVVAEVDQKRRVVSLQIPELNDGKPFSIKVTRKIPRWLLQKGVLFMVDAPFAYQNIKKIDGIILSNFRLHPCTHLTTTELAQKLLNSIIKRGD